MTLRYSFVYVNNLTKKGKLINPVAAAEGEPEEGYTAPLLSCYKLSYDLVETIK